MARFIKIPLQDLIDSGADAVGTTDKLTVASTADYTVGDYVHNTDNDTYATITVIDSATVASLSADIMSAAENYSVYSATEATNVRTISAERYLMVDQTNTSPDDIGNTRVFYASGGENIMTFVNSGDQQTSQAIGLAFEAAFINASNNNVRPSNYTTLEMPEGTGVFSYTIA